MKKAIIFDLDGTLWNATGIFKIVYDMYAKKKNETFVYSIKDFENIMGSSPIDVVQRIADDKKWDIERAANFFKGYYMEVLNYLKTHPGKLYEKEEETLKVLSEIYDLYIVSNSSVGYVQSYLDGYKFEKYFKGYLQAGDTGLSKADNIIKLMKDYNIKDAVYVGDTMKDYEACKSANVPLVYASYGFGEVKEYKYRLNKISDLLDLKNVLFS